MALTRVRVEASAETRNGVQDDLVSATSAIQESFGGEWKQAGTDVIHSKNGYWGYMVITCDRSKA